MSIALQLTDEFVAALFQRAHELRLIEEPRRWAELEGVADYLGVSVRRARDLRERGMPAKRIGRRLLFDLREVDAWLETHGWTRD
jgi:excisionase family DNA binding protein